MRKLISFFVKYPIWSNAIILMVALGGIMSLALIKRSFFPEVESRVVTVSVAYPGASPVEMEEGITNLIENSLKGIVGIEEFSSKSAENISTVTIIFVQGYNMEEGLADVENAVDKINGFPDNAEKPIVTRVKNMDRVASLVLYGSQDLFKLKEIAEAVEDDFLASGILSQVDINGLAEPELSIEIHEDALVRYNLTFQQVAQAIRANNQDISLGTLKSDKEELYIRSNRRSLNPELIENIVLKSEPTGNIVYVKDVATAKFQFQESPNQAIFKGSPSVEISIKKLNSEDILQIIEYIKNYIEAFNKIQEPVQLELVFDHSIALQERIDILTSNGLIGLLLVVIVLGIFINPRLALWVSLGIPFSFLGMLIVANMMDITINQLSLFGMILVVGILVDDGIVVAENIHVHRERGSSPLKAVIDGTLEVIPSVFTSVLTTIVAFVFFFTLDGNFAEFMQQVAWVVILCLSFSLIEATIILPTHLHFKNKNKNKERKPNKFHQWYDNLRNNHYGRLLNFINKWRWGVLASAIALYIITFNGLIPGKFIKMEVFPEIDSNTLTMQLVLQQGTTENVTLEILEKAEKSVWVINEKLKEERGDSTDMILYTTIITGANDMETGGHAGKIEIRMEDEEVRQDLTGFKVANLIKEEIGEIKEAKKFTLEGRQWWGKPVSYKFMSRSKDALNALASDVKSYLENRGDLKNIIDSDVEGKREIHIQLKDEAFALGLNYESITNQIRQGFFGAEIQRIQKGKDEVKIWTRYPDEGRENISKLENIKIKTANGELYPLSYLVNFNYTRGVVAIDHFNGQRVITVEADKKDPSKVIDSEVIKADIDTLLSNYPQVQKAFGGREREFQKLMSSMVISLPLLVITIYVILALMFRSWAQPIIVILMILPAAAGAVLGHGIQGKAVVMMSYFGILALSGVVINDSVVFLDRFNTNIRNGFKVAEAIKNAGISRFRAIMLTSLTTVAGLYPLVFEKSNQAQFLIPIGITIAYGVFFGTIFILVVFPGLIMCLNDIRWLCKALWEGKKPTREEIEPAYRELKRLQDVEED